jgi:hypothetical protein
MTSNHLNASHLSANKIPQSISSSFKRLNLRLTLSNQPTRDHRGSVNASLIAWENSIKNQYRPPLAQLIEITPLKMQKQHLSRGAIGDQIMIMMNVIASIT